MSYLREKAAKQKPFPKNQIKQLCSLEVFQKTTETNENNFKSYTNKFFKKNIEHKIGTSILKSNNKVYIKCSNKNCTYIIKLSSDIQPDCLIKCPALHQTCPKCFMSNHAPFACNLVSTVLENSDAISRSEIWISANSKKCSQCGKYIEKTGGGNLMTCTCGRQFCWLCLSDWMGHDRSICGRLERELENKQGYAKKVNENFKRFEIKFPILQETINSCEGYLNLFENSIKKNKNIKFDRQILSGILEFIRESWISVYYGFNLGLFKTKVRKAEKIEKICSKINDFLLPIMNFFKNDDEKSLKSFIQFLKEEKNVRNLLDLKEHLRTLQELFVDMKILKKENFCL